MAQLSAALHLATMWGFDATREYIIKQIDLRFPPTNPDFNPFDRLDLAEKNNVPKWKRPAYASICKRKDRLTLEEAERLGLARTLAVCNIRERCLPKPHWSRCDFCRTGSFCDTHGTTTMSTGIDSEKVALGLD